MCKQCKISIDESHPGSRAVHNAVLVDEWLEQCGERGKVCNRVGIETEQSWNSEDWRITFQSAPRTPSSCSKKWPRAVMELASRDQHQNTDIDTIITRHTDISTITSRIQTLWFREYRHWQNHYQTYRHWHHHYQTYRHYFQSTDTVFSRIQISLWREDKL